MEKEYSEIIVSPQRLSEINPNMIGLFFEDLSNSADGGLYAELVKNRSFGQLMPTFEYTINEEGKRKERLVRVENAPDYGWSVLSGKAEFKTEPRTCVSLMGGIGGAAVSNKGYDGIYVERGKSYRCLVLADLKGYSGEIVVSIGGDRENIVSRRAADEDGFSRLSAVLTASGTVKDGELVISFPELGAEEQVIVGMVSLMPKDAVLGIFRRDMAEAMKEIKPGFLRFPGGCVVEGYNLDNRYRWNDTVGPIEHRKQNWNRWAFKQDDYNQTFGIGFYEYFLLCEYLECEPLPVLNAGMACQFNTCETVPVFKEDGETYTEEFKEYIDDALDLIEFANGSVSTYWGALRAEMGHSEPFNLKFLGVGNEQWIKDGNMWHERYEAFERAIHEKYPHIGLINSAGPDVTSERYTEAYDWIRGRMAKNKNFTCAVDEHNYNTKEWLFENTDFYKERRGDIPVYVGEYAAKAYTDEEGVCRFNDMISALSEGAYLMGMERSANVVKMASYAPLFSKEGPYSHWKPNMIWFNKFGLCKTPNYYVQKLFGNNMGSHVLKSRASFPMGKPLHYSASFDESSGDIIVKVINSCAKEERLKISFEGFEVRDGEKQVLAAPSAEEKNTVDNPNNIRVAAEPMERDNIFEALLPYSLTVFRLHTK